MIYAISVFVVIQLLDVMSTYLVLKNGGVEANPFLNWVFEKFGGWVGLLVKLAISGAGGYALFLYDYEVMLWVLNAVVGAVVYNNFRIWKKIR